MHTKDSVFMRFVTIFRRKIKKCKHTVELKKMNSTKKKVVRLKPRKSALKILQINGYSTAQHKNVRIKAARDAFGAMGAMKSK